MPTNPHLLVPARPPSHWAALAERIRHHPEILDAALANLERWQTWGRTHPEPIRQWRQQIHVARSGPREWEKFLGFLAAADPDREPMFSCSPFVGPEFEG